MRSTSRSPITAALLVLTLALSACVSPEKTGQTYDPYEAQNRAVHEFNKTLDKNIVRPVALTYGKSTPSELRQAISNLSDNLDLPGMVLNDLLQFQLGDAIANTLRFAMNTTFGIGGLFDPAGEVGLPARTTDFGETLYVWGFGEGAYVELPLLGPSTSRDAVGKLVDAAINPLNRVVPPSKRLVIPAINVAASLGNRYRFRTTIDSILYESADSYAQSRLLFLENRRFELGIKPQQQQDLYQGLYNDILSQ